MSWSARSVRAVAIVLCGILVVVGYTWWQGRARPVIDVPEAAATAGPSLADVVTVHVVGRVRRPGVVSLPFGSRVADAVEAAGGLKAGASSGDLNLARVLVDGEQVVVGQRPSSPDANPAAGSTAASGDGLLNINAASATELEALPGVGPVLAGRIVAWREANGPFPSVEILGEVTGIGDALLAQLRPLVRV